ncbi:MAG: GLPGLI family protein [Lutibacter sp.]|nr:GLPGLI family protein [Lutibacter sp.]
MKLILYLIILSFSTLHSQQTDWVQIEYTQILGSQITNAKLLYNNHESVYYFGDVTKIDTTSLNMTFIVTDDIGTVVYKNQKERRLFTRMASKKEVVLITDDFPNLNWTLSDETKKSADFTLTKAFANFRGRKYIAWFSEQLSGNNGPLKMGGLPGTILEMETEDGFLKVTFDKIIFNISEPVQLDSIINKYDKILTQQQWVTASKEAIENFTAKLMSKQTRDATFIISIDESLENVYEWENEENK